MKEKGRKRIDKRKLKLKGEKKKCTSGKRKSNRVHEEKQNEKPGTEWRKMSKGRYHHNKGRSIIIYCTV